MAMTAPDNGVELSVLIVAFNSRGCIDDCLSALQRECAGISHEILLIDNGLDGSGDYVASAFPDVCIVPSEGNIGFARANNILASEATGSVFLLVNPDVLVLEGSIKALLHGRERHSRAAAWGGITVDRAGQPDTGNAIPVPSLTEFASAALGRSASVSRLASLGNGDQQVSLLSGGFMMIDRAAWDRVGGFDESFFLYCEEVDLFARLSVKGEQFWRIGDARAHHAIAHGNSLSPLRSLYRTAGTVHFVRKHWPTPNVWIAIALIWWAAFARFVAGSLFGWASGRLAKLGRGYSAVCLKPGLWIHGYDPTRGLKAQMDQAAP